MSIQAKRSLTCFLNNMKSVKEGTFTHTSITDPPGSFYIQADQEEKFFKLYKDALENGCDLFFTEKHRDISPVLIDLDFRYPVDCHEKKYNHNHIKKILEIYLEEIDKYVEIPEKTEIYVMEKSEVTVDEKKNIVKDGIHIVISNIVTRKSIQLIVRKKILDKLDMIFKEIGSINSTEDIFDECVIDKNNWQMYGSRKPNSEAYSVTKHYTFFDNKFEENEIKNEKEYVEELSIRNKYIENKNKPEFKEDIKALDMEIKKVERKKENKKKLFEKIVQQRENNFCSKSDQADLVRKLLTILDDKRSNLYIEWIQLGWCLRNIDSNLLNDWIEFSKRSNKYVEGECEQMWYRMREGGLGIGTLHMWAKHDNPEEYGKIISEDISHLIYKSLSETDYDIAMVICRMFKHKYRCASVKNHIWYEFRNHRWVSIEKGYTLFYEEIPVLLFNEYMKMIQAESSRAQSTTNERDKDICSKNVETLSKITRKLKNTEFVKNKMYKECSGMFYEPNFEEKLDSNPCLLGFENGIYDLENHEFREGRPEDYVSFSTGINYIEYDENNPYVEEIEEFFGKVLTNDGVKQYVLMLMASMLDGNNRDEKFYIFTGGGANGKSKCLELYQNTIGDYGCIFNVSLLTQKRVGSSSTNSELAIAKGKRFAILQEPEENEKMNVGLMKELSGGDKIQCRGLFKEPIKYKPMFTMILVCNHMPSLPAEDGGTWRRVRRIEFLSHFTDNPDINKSNEFMIDKDLPYKFECWKETFMTMLLKIFKQYKENGEMKEPPEVLEATKDYQRKNDIFADYFEECLEESNGEFMSVTDMFSSFKMWVQEENAKGGKMVKKSQFQESISKKIGSQPIRFRGKMGWKGYCVKQSEPMNQEDC